VLELEAFLSSVPPSSTLYLDLEGNCLSRHGTISLIAVLIYPQGVVRLIDVFTKASNNGKTLKSILEDPDIPKCAWDVRNDADALWALYHVGLAGVTDIQLLENASRAGDKTYIRGLDKSVQFDAEARVHGDQSLDPDQGGPEGCLLLMIIARLVNSSRAIIGSIISKAGCIHGLTRLHETAGSKKEPLRRARIPQMLQLNVM
jgi:hypothetical protein